MSNTKNEKAPQKPVGGSIKRRSRILAWTKLFILPISIAIGGWWVQAVVNSSTIQKEYVSLSINILSSKDPAPGLREWAAALLDHTSPIPLPSATKLTLSSGVAYLPSPQNRPLDDPGTTSMAFAPNVGDDDLKGKVRVLNTAIKSIESKERPLPYDQLLVSELTAQRDRILRQKFGASLYGKFLRNQGNSSSLSDPERAEFEIITEWSNQLLSAPPP